MRTVTGTTTPLQSTAKLKLQLGNLTAHHTFFLADIADECILGMDYLKPAGAVLDLGKSLMTIDGEKISLKGAKDAEPVCRRVVAAVTTTFPPNSEAVISVKLAEQEKVWKPGWGLLHSSNAYSKKGLLVGRTLVDLNHEVLPVRVMNVTTITQNIKKGSDLAKCELVDEVVMEKSAPPPINSNEQGQLPDHVKGLFERSAKDLSAA